MRAFLFIFMAIVRVTIWDEENFLQRISSPEDTFLIESIDASGSDSNVLKIAPLTASAVIIGNSGIATFISGVLSGNFITGTFYGDGSQLRGLITTLNGLTGSITLLSSSDFLKITSSSNGQVVFTASHRPIDQLVHNVAENSYEEFTYDGVQILSSTIYTDSTKTTKVREENYIYDIAFRIATSSLIQFNASGVEIERLTQKYTYSGNTIISITGALT